jgi:Zinc-finger of the MIZ type in Nse subunit
MVVYMSRVRDQRNCIPALDFVIDTLRVYDGERLDTHRRRLERIRSVLTNSRYVLLHSALRDYAWSLIKPHLTGASLQIDQPTYTSEVIRVLSYRKEWPWSDMVRWLKQRQILDQQRRKKAAKPDVRRIHRVRVFDPSTSGERFETTKEPIAMSEEAPVIATPFPEPIVMSEEAPVIATPFPEPIAMSEEAPVIATPFPESIAMSEDAPVIATPFPEPIAMSEEAPVIATPFPEPIAMSEEAPVIAIIEESIAIPLSPISADIGCEAPTTASTRSVDVQISTRGVKESEDVRKLGFRATCPITCDTIRHAVISECCGRLFEKSAIETHFRLNRRKCPTCRQRCIVYDVNGFESSV